MRSPKPEVMELILCLPLDSQRIIHIKKNDFILNKT